MKNFIAIPIIATFSLLISSCGVPPDQSPTSTDMKITAWLAESLARRDPPPIQPDLTQPPVILVHGIDGCGRDLTRLARALQATGRTVHAIDLHPNNGSAPIEDLSAQLQKFVATHVPAEQPFDLIGYSMGGIVSRHYLQERGGHQKTRHFISISAPHQGTFTGYLRNRPGAHQLRPGSNFLAQLATPESLAKLPPTTSFLTVTDLVIVPFTSSEIPGAQNLRLFGWGHFTGIIEPHALRKIVAACNQKA